ncbi:MAG TPA: hypothetical protein VNV65_08790 [Candidatus Solibacter sp.]|nr:hypothetical protein [Candidatus Solibacter sp.]
MASHRESQAALSRLRGVLRGQPPATLSELNRQDLEDLADAVDSARRQHSEALSAALDNAFDQVPRLFRSTVRRIVTR